MEFVDKLKLYIASKEQFDELQNKINAKNFSNDEFKQCKYIMYLLYDLSLSNVNIYNVGFKTFKEFYLFKANIINSIFEQSSHLSANVRDFFRVNLNQIAKQNKFFYTEGKLSFFQGMDSYVKNIDNVISGNLNDGNNIYICKTPIILKMLGFPDNDILMNRKKLIHCYEEKNTIKHTHGIGKEILYKLPELIEKPAIIMRSLDRTRQNSLILVLDEIDNDKLPLITIIEKDKLGKYNFKIVETNDLVSIYGKDNFINFLINTINENKALFFDKNTISYLESKSHIDIINRLNDTIQNNRRNNYLVLDAIDQYKRDNNNNINKEKLKELMQTGALEQASAFERKDTIDTNFSNVDFLDNKDLTNVDYNNEELKSTKNIKEETKQYLPTDNDTTKNNDNTNKKDNKKNDGNDGDDGYNGGRK